MFRERIRWGKGEWANGDGEVGRRGQREREREREDEGEQKRMTRNTGRRRAKAEEPEASSDPRLPRRTPCHPFSLTPCTLLALLH